MSGDHNFNSLKPRQNCRHFAHGIFKCIFLNENVWILIKISLKYVPKGAINNTQALVQIMAWRWPGNKPLSEPMMVNLPTHICVTRPQWFKITTISPRGQWVNSPCCVACYYFHWLTVPFLDVPDWYFYVSPTNQYNLLPLACCLNSNQLFVIKTTALHDLSQRYSDVMTWYLVFWPVFDSLWLCIMH